jgi:hypothetical protein
MGLTSMSTKERRDLKAELAEVLKAIEHAAKHNAPINPASLAVLRSILAAMD